MERLCCEVKLVIVKIQNPRPLKIRKSQSPENKQWAEHDLQFYIYTAYNLCDLTQLLNFTIPHFLIFIMRQNVALRIYLKSNLGNSVSSSTIL